MSYIARLTQAAPPKMGPSPTFKTVKSPFEAFEGSGGTHFSGSEQNHPTEPATPTAGDGRDIADRAATRRLQEPAPVVRPSECVTNDWEERAAILEYEARLPRSWAEPFARLLTGPTPGDFSPTRWEAARDAGFAFADQWSAEAFRKGWGPEDVFGLHRTLPAARVDCRGLAWLLGDGSRVVAIDPDGADIVTPRGGRQRFWRHGSAHSRASKTGKASA